MGLLMVILRTIYEATTKIQVRRKDGITVNHTKNAVQNYTLYANTND
jgi:capsular polysaccharide biosynthesis protein